MNQRWQRYLDLVASNTGLKSSADSNQNVSFVYCLEHWSAHQDRAEMKRVVAGNSAFTVRCCDDRRVYQFRKYLQSVRGFGSADSAARQNNPFVRFLENIDRLPQVFSIRGDRVRYRACSWLC